MRDQFLDFLVDIKACHLEQENAFELPVALQGIHECDADYAATLQSIKVAYFHLDVKCVRQHQVHQKL